ncbi:O-antigen ligase family protein [Parabacteroides pacaensis]|uniref:O-antigen ligase family protein n=1 Tax=Parabacteroides pacaensis TaxID=2086575 RepID=UPI000D1113EF|nr:O-antigen ligase family protein [Parabacteroides pacaensis]
MKLTYYIQTYFFALSGILVLCSILVNTPELVNFTVTGQECWFHLTMLFMGTCLFVVAGIKKGGMKFTFTFPDGCILLYLLNMLLWYNWDMNPAPNKLIFWFQLGVLWLMIRIIVSTYPTLFAYFLWGIIALGCIEAIWGIRQLYGFTLSNHSLYRLTGSFYNPGPYSGFMALIFPIALNEMLKLRKMNPEKPEYGRKVLYYFAFFTLLLIISVLPAGMSRTAWISVLAASCWVLWRHFQCGNLVKKVWKNYRVPFIAGIITISIMGIALGIGIFLLKKDSANGRLFLWKITSKAILENPLEGTGLGSFAGTYAIAQENYFRSGNATETEMLVAGSPEYAFNEYLQIWLEEGLSGLICFILVLISCFLQAKKNNQTGLGGAILALAIFAFASYPIQLPAFGILGIFVLTGAVNTFPTSYFSIYLPFTFLGKYIGGVHKYKKDTSNTIIKIKGALPHFFYPDKPISFLFICFLSFSCFVLFYKQKDNYTHFRKWNALKTFYQAQAYESALEGYKELYPYLNSYPFFLFEYAQSLNKKQLYNESIIILQRAASLSADPMIYNVMAKNYQALGAYKKAENFLIKSTFLLPERIYPYYLLAKLYAEPDFYDSRKLQLAAQVVLTKQAKIQSTAIKEMRKEINDLLKTVQSP